MFDKIKQLQQMKGQMDAAKERLNHISVKGECQGITVVANGNKKIIEVVIPKSLEGSGREELAGLIVIATNKALENAESVFESEMRGMAGGLMGGLGF
ncbi:MAG: YbaB/EbfC family nucleoid-associated protein [Flavobacteriales bacterium]|nr:YbaB/EbfC family nucleoid-associated protein [Flavobacteriales bacterium]